MVLFTTARPLPREKADGAEPAPGSRREGEDPAPPPLPWALELANGARCAPITGASAIFAGMRLNYACDDQGSVLGDVDRGEPVWTVSYLPPDGIASELMEVTIAWF